METQPDNQKLQQVVDKGHEENLRELKQGFLEMEQKFELQSQTLLEILTSLIGSRLMPNGGIVNDIKAMKGNQEIINERLKALEEFKNKFYWTITIVSLICTFIGATVGLTIAYLNYSKR